MIAHLARDLRHAARAIARMPGMAAVVIGSLAVGIAANTVVFSWVQAVVFKPIPGVTIASRLLLVEARTEAGLYPGSSWPEYRDLRERLRSMEGLLAFRMIPLYVGESDCLATVACRSPEATAPFCPVKETLALRLVLQRLRLFSRRPRFLPP